MATSAKNFYEFGPYRMDPDRGVLLRGEATVALTAKAFETLLILVRNSEQVVSKDELMKLLWPDTFVEEANLTQHISMVRKALGESPQDHRYIVTLPGRGYRFAQRVRIVPQDSVIPDTSYGAADTVVTKRPAVWKYSATPVLFGVVLLVAMGLATYLVRFRPKPVSTPSRVMLAVLPFQNLSNDAEQEYFSDGLTEETITDLGQLSPDKLGVIARTSAMAYKHTGKTAQQIGQELGVDYLLEGSVRREGDRVRISAQLIRAKDQTHVWAQSYDRDLRDFLAVQNELGDAIAQQVQVNLSRGQRQGQSNSRRINPDAYDDYLRGQYEWNQFTVPSLRKSIDYFEQAIAKDPGLAQAYAGLAQSYGVLMDLNKLPPAEAYLKSEVAARKAVELDPQASEAHSALGWQLLGYDRDFASAQREFQQAVDLNASNADAHDGLANYFAIAKQFDRSIAEVKKARELDPFSLVMNFDSGKMLFYARQYDQAIRQLRFSLDLYPNAFPPHYLLQLVYQAQGRYEEAYEEFAKEMTAGGPASATMVAIEKIHAKSGWKAAWQEMVARRGLSSWDLAGLMLALGDKRKTIDLLNEASGERLSQVIYLNVDPRYDSLRSDRGFQDLVRRLGLPP